MRIRIPLIFTLISLLSSGCATFDPDPIAADQSVTPDEISRGVAPPDSKAIKWGGVIVNLKNLKHSTELQIIAYPLLDSHLPDTEEPPVGRFIAIKRGYLEAVDYARGRQVTIDGDIDRLREGKVGQAAYLFPVVLARNIRLWPKRRVDAMTPRFNFGFGIGSGGTTRGSMGVGIGF